MAAPASRDPEAGEERPAQPVDWAFAARVGHRVAGREPLADSYHHQSLVSDFALVTAEAAGLVAEFTGLAFPPHEAGLVVDRQEWVTLNLASFRHLLDPLTRRLAERLPTNALAGINRRVAGAETGALLGFFAQRVLGQYDLVGAETGGPAQAASGRVYYVGPNVLSLEKRFGFRPREFRRWIALHEVTHLIQFTGVPWLRGYFFELVDASLGLLDPDPKRLAGIVRHVVDEVRAGRNPLDEGGVVGLLATPEQRQLLRRVQALMALLEGHGNFVMNRLGREHVAGHDRMSEVLRARRTAGGWSGRVQRVVGLEMKLRQYEVGESFLNAVEERAGLGILSELWTGPEALPDLDELGHPERWCARVGLSV